MAPTHTIPNLPPAVTFDVLQTLRTSLPPPAAATEGSLEARIETAMAVVVAYHPADISETLLAAQIVVADAQAIHCLRLAVAPDADAETIRRCRAQAAARCASCKAASAFSSDQAAREKAETEMHPAAMERAGYWFHEVSVPAPPVPLVPTEDAAEPVLDPVAEAEHYALIYPDRAALIRAHGGLPPRLTFGPPEPDIVAALVNGASPALRAIAPHPAMA